MQKQIIMFCFFLVQLFGESVSAQSQSAFPSLLYPRTVTSSGLGEQGVASMSAADAIQYNPANLIFSDGVSLSFFRNPWNLFFEGFPLTSASAVIRLSNGGSIGAEYTDWDLGESTITTEQSPDGGQLFHSYERSLAAGYAIPLNNEIAIGGQLRYVWQSYPFANTIDHVLFSLGANYRPSEFFDRFNLGLSFMNFSTPIVYKGNSLISDGLTVEVSSSDPPPAQINFGMTAVAITNTFADVDLMLGVKKPIQKTDGSPEYNAESSFHALTSDWQDFPNDMTVQVGLDYAWHPIDVGRRNIIHSGNVCGIFFDGTERRYQFFLYSRVLHRDRVTRN